ncbi:hypothetical protein [Stutzerimonas stutzeri]|uniref:hypothetical protein n=1 Tax=Stutzerimonas stutzeri TaxID=316 RepID=UPI002108C00E|nr:hypothetical protein [Stutzerimonas stutzeri]MCQ4320653.1 hypothetical protein [Stutzerimonas stutzeri]
MGKASGRLFRRHDAGQGNHQQGGKGDDVVTPAIPHEPPWVAASAANSIRLIALHGTSITAFAAVSNQDEEPNGRIYTGCAKAKRQGGHTPAA